MKIIIYRLSKDVYLYIDRKGTDRIIHLWLGDCLMKDTPLCFLLLFYYSIAFFRNVERNNNNTSTNL